MLYQLFEDKKSKREQNIQRTRAMFIVTDISDIEKCLRILVFHDFHMVKSVHLVKSIMNCTMSQFV